MSLEATRSILTDLIAFPTVSADSNLTLIDYAAERLSHSGARVFLMKDATGLKANLFASIGPDCDGGIVLSGHTDVVPADESEWQSDPFSAREADGLIYGRGACDMKGFIAAALAMAPDYASLNLKRPIHFAFTYDEEVGCLGGQQLVSELARRGIKPSVAIIGEPTDMRIIEGHKGCYEYTTEFIGLEGHASNPDLGVNAIEYAVRYIGRLLEIGGELRQSTPSSPFTPPWTTIQTGRIEGGKARNVIAGHCAVEWEMRPVRGADVDYVKRRIATYCEEVLLPAMRAVSPSACIHTHVVGEIDGLEPVTDNEARAIVSALTGATTADVVSFGTEAGLFQKLGISTVVCGPGSIDQAHKPDEFISCTQLKACLDMLSGLKQRLTT
ncbi:acetylornithine deacetylase [Rhizobium mesosinicum]|uniref:Acetylornithine deacetylase n=1 Tax=Rhizobium mesosinicum TaxID=335017 RepID=A0ABS7GQE9_9HYPH|nr:acetylornithine deacetylase [Rhizobium mesosinicum]MBW9051444.1 acetylornithine deacetylase [Rhizobium mesosinicum]